MASQVTAAPTTPPPPSWLLELLLGVRRPREVAGLLPGFLLACGVLVLALPLADLAGGALLRLQGLDPAGRASPISPVLAAIVLGAALRNLARLPQATERGIHFCVTKVLRLGIVLIGLKLSLFEIARLGAWGVPIVVITIASGLLLIAAFNRLLGLPSELGTLMAAGTSICGVTAIVSTAAAIRAPQREMAYAVTNITLFGLLAMLAYPQLAPHLLQSPEQIGLFFGTAIHDTSQVVGAALTYRDLHHDDVAFRTATVTKLTRNLFLAVVVPLAAVLYARRAARTATAGSPNSTERSSILKLLPLFVGGFVALAAVRTIGDLTLRSGGAAWGWMSGDTWHALTAFVAETLGSRSALGVAMAGVGLSTSFGVFRGLGFRPLIVGLVGAVLVAAVGYALAATLGRHVHL
jgi:uncharacterized integral membrane protein (TIGR00698 family)